MICKKILIGFVLYRHIQFFASDAAEKLFKIILRLIFK